MTHHKRETNRDQGAGIVVADSDSDADADPNSQYYSQYYDYAMVFSDEDNCQEQMPEKNECPDHHRSDTNRITAKIRAGLRRGFFIYYCSYVYSARRTKVDVLAMRHGWRSRNFFLNLKYLFGFAAYKDYLLTFAA